MNTLNKLVDIHNWTVVSSTRHQLEISWAGEYNIDIKKAFAELQELLADKKFLAEEVADRIVKICHLQAENKKLCDLIAALEATK